MKESAERHDQLLEFLMELAAQLIACGYTLPILMALVERAYIQAASEKARLRNTRINQSALAAITGLSRGQVRLVAAKLKREPPQAIDPITRVISGWTTDHKYCDPDSGPRPLLVGQAARRNLRNFTGLAKRYGGDIPPRTLLREMTRRRLIRLRGNNVELASLRGSKKSIGDNVSAFSGVFSRALRPPVNQKNVCPIKTDYYQIIFPVLDKKSVAVLQKRLRQAFKAFASDVESAVDSLEEQCIKVESKSKKLSKIGVILVSHT